MYILVQTCEIAKCHQCCVMVLRTMVMLTTHADSFSMQPSHVADACCMENLMFYSDVMMLDASHAACFGLIQTRRFGQVHPFALESFLGSAPTSQWHQQSVSLFA